MKSIQIHLLLGIIGSLLTNGVGEIVQMKIVNEVSNYGWNAGVGADSSSKLTAKVPPAPFSGPMSLKPLSRKCFSYLGDYKFEFCPFNNVTQHERSMRWNPYSGVVGVWLEWEIVNNTFTAMILKNGEDCGSVTRQARVLLKCGAVNNITSVTEPSRCQYELVFESPLVCHPDAMLVYITLNASLRSEWDNIEQELYDDYITKKGYNRRLFKLFEKAGLMTVPKENVFEKFQDYTSLELCNTDYRTLLEEVKQLRKHNSKFKT